ncbi:MAG: PfkB family carbohydrate kinase, partial [Verrucomicrobia bacterium]|nr:PfkB family carbohydrate kinase [Verrucomicrobiota bacterium]
LGRALVSEADVMSAMREFAAGGAGQVVVTASREPVLAFDGRRYWRIRPPAIRALNPIGSGDAFTAALVWRLVRGDDLGEACRWACAAGVANAMTWMAGEVRRADVNRLAKAVRVLPSYSRRSFQRSESVNKSCSGKKPSGARRKGKPVGTSRWTMLSSRNAAQLRFSPRTQLDRNGVSVVNGVR